MGDSVELYGLQEDAGHNGSHGVVDELLADKNGKQRCLVRLENGQFEKVMRNNLRILFCPPVPQKTESRKLSTLVSKSGVACRKSFTRRGWRRAANTNTTGTENYFESEDDMTPKREHFSKNSLPSNSSQEKREDEQLPFLDC